VQGVRLRAHGEAQQADDSGQLAAQNIEPQTGADYFGHGVPSRRDPFKRSSYWLEPLMFFILYVLQILSR